MIQLLFIHSLSLVVYVELSHSLDLIEYWVVQQVDNQYISLDHSLFDHNPLLLVQIRLSVYLDLLDDSQDLIEDNEMIKKKVMEGLM